MVYKKIVNNIPSLSSLLLAGMVLGGSCNGKKNGAVSGTGGDAEVGNEVSDKKFSPELSKARWDAWAFIFGSKQLSYACFLNKEKQLDPMLPETYTISRSTTLETMTKLLEERVRSLKERFSLNGGITQNVETALASLIGWLDVKNKTNVSAHTQQKKYFPHYGKAIEQIVCIYNTFYSLIQELRSTQDSIHKGQYDINFKWKTKEEDLDTFYNNYIKDKFGLASRIAVAKNGEKKDILLDEHTEQLLPFLISSSSEGEGGASELMEEQVGNVMIHANNGDTLLDEINVQRDIKAGNDKTKKPYHFHIPKITGGVDLRSGSRVLTFKELLFLLCKGTLESKKDAKVENGIFGVISDTSGKKDGKLKSNPDAYKKFASDAQNPDLFVTHITDLIRNNSLKGWWSVDISEASSQLEELISKYASQAPLCNATNFTTELLKKMVEWAGATGATGITIPDRVDADGVDTVLDEIITKTSDAQTSGNSLQLISCRLANQIVSDTILLGQLKQQGGFTVGTLKDELLQMLESKKMQENLLCITVGGKPKLTSLGVKFQGMVCRFDKILKENKGTERSCTYEEIKKSTGFDIEPINKWVEETYHLLKAFLVLPDKLANVFYKYQDDNQTVDYATEIGIQNADLGLDQNPVIDKLDSFRHEYLKAKKKTEQPETPATPAA
ncbi:hypothetical protein [Candidatus Cardinium hertigii]|uniref:Uncharacterized protein n=1 Tax=Candidatus Cardinium hertigii TaxID=247481 RepID=A0A2Z3L8J1_9BACT|nr:hypothetical protein [Candidatus Cardinium hertigii]AWN81729.1 hypothetical protein DK880_00401 [Candidatus Cardinium hertigii]